MRRQSHFLRVLTFAVSFTALSAHAASLQEAANTLGAFNLKSLEFSGSGHWFNFGQAAAPGAAWPTFDVKSYEARINYEIPAAQVALTRIQVNEPNRQRPTPTEQKLNWLVSGDKAWNFQPPNNAPPGAAPVATPQPAQVEQRISEIWETPQGFLKAALANNAKSQASGSGVEVSFESADKHRYVGFINAKNEVEWVKSWIDSPVLGDTLFETKFKDYKDFGGVQFPAELTRIQGEHPVLHINVASAKLNSGVDIAIPENIASFKAEPPAVKSEKLADGVYWLTGGTHHSVLIEQKDHIVLVEAPLNEERSLAVIAKVNEIAPGKPIKYIVNSHVHFDHSGGLRTLVDAGATVVTHELDKPYYEKIWAAPHTLRPDRLAQSKKPAKFETYADKHVLSDGERSVEIHRIAGNGHSDELALIYLPKEKILVEADAYTPTAKDAPLPKTPNPYSVNLYENIQKLKLDVAQIAGLHGPRIVTLADLRAAIGQSPLAQ